MLRKTFPFLFDSGPFCSLSIQGSSWSVGLTVYLSISVKFVKNARLSPCYRERAAVVCFEIKPQLHIHGFGPGRATVHPDLASR